MPDTEMKTTVSEAKNTSKAPISAFPAFRPRGLEALLDCLSMVEGADSVLLHHLTGLAAGDIATCLSRLARHGCIGPMPDRSQGLPSLLRLTDRGRQAHATIRRWRFKTSAVVLLSALSGR
jgi:hypothetical protein